ncbi:MAG: hypothetical protein AAFO89_07015 [Planctomycetota bacterium]
MSFDGRWANNDQLSNRHSGNGNILLIDGVVESFEPSDGPQGPEVREEQDFTANDFYVKIKDVQNGNRIQWDNLWADGGGRSSLPYGWVNQAR